MKNYRESYKTLFDCLSDHQIYDNEKVEEALQDIAELVSIATTPVCAECEPQDLDTAKIKLRLMADEANRQIAEYKAEIDKLKAHIRKRG